MMHGFSMSFGLIWLIVPALFVWVAVPVVRQLMRSVRPGLRNPEPDRRLEGGQHEATIYRLAKDRGGKITVSDVVVETGMSVSRAEETLHSMLDGVRVRVEVTDNGTMLFEFPELM